MKNNLRVITKPTIILVSFPTPTLGTPTLKLARGNEKLITQTFK